MSNRYITQCVAMASENEDIDPSDLRKVMTSRVFMLAVAEVCRDTEIRTEALLTINVIDNEGIRDLARQQGKIAGMFEAIDLLCEIANIKDEEDGGED